MNGMEMRIVLARGTMYLEVVLANRGVDEDNTGFGRLC
jgi:hypothetical protein